MSTISLLDCTLRDGGYVNDWRFGQDNIVSIFERLVNSNVDIIEVGFLDDRRPFDIDRSIMPDTESVGKIYGGLDKGNAQVFGMIDFGTCDIDNIQPCSESYLDGIRVIFKKHLMHQAMEYCRQLKELGYKVCSQLVSITSYNDDELLEIIKLVNDVEPYAVGIVDTYGLLHPEDLLHYYEIMDANVKDSIKIGFHAHNNFQLAYANVLAFIGRKTDRDIIVDGTLYGMGKSAGNAPLELVAMRLNDKFEGSYDVDSMLESIEESIMKFYVESPWGYKEFFYLCSKNNCHPNYLTYFEEKENLSTTKIDRMMARIEPEDKKLLYDKAVAEQLYQSFINDEYSDYKDRLAFVRETSDKKLLLLGPGKNIRLQNKKIRKFIDSNNVYIISINYIPEEYDVDCVFLTNAKRYHDMTLQLKSMEGSTPKFLATTNVECRNGSFDYVINRAPLLETKENIIDNSMLMLIKFLMSIDVKIVYCAGFDGYSDKEDNYCNPAMEYSFIKKEAANLNRHIKEAITQLRESIEINFITYSAYDVDEDINRASI